MSEVRFSIMTDTGRYTFHTLMDVDDPDVREQITLQIVRWSHGIRDLGIRHVLSTKANPQIGSRALISFEAEP